jgi:chorismate mutase/prephenate dehydratase
MSKKKKAVSAVKMTPTRSIPGATPDAPSSISAQQLEQRCQELDRTLVELLNERTRTMQQLSRLREEAGGPQVGSFAADEAVLNTVRQANTGPLSPATMQAIFRELLGGTRALIRRQRVAYLGPQFSYSYIATTQRFGTAADLVPVGTIAAVFDEVDRGHADLGVVPLENSTDGRVSDTLTMFAKLPVRICGEVQLRIHHCLMARCQRAEIQEVYSKPQALSQCRDWLARHLPGARLIEMTSTAAAAQLAATKPGVAAIANRLAAVANDLDVVAENIEDNKNNITRFAVIGGETAPWTGQDKTALLFEIPHEPGALADVMMVFKRARLNLTWIESYPLFGAENEYFFFVELLGHESETHVQKAFNAIRRHTSRVVVLGSYAISKPID